MTNLNSAIDGIFANANMTAEQKYAAGIHLLACFGAAMGHRPFVAGAVPTYGNLCMVAVGNSGCGKGTALRFTKSLFASVPSGLLAPESTTTSAGSMKALAREIDSILSAPALAAEGEVRVYHVNEEFSGELKSAASVYQSKLPEFLCKLVDGSEISETLGRQRIEYPLIHYGFVGHITPAALRSSLRPALVSGGCANRMLWLTMPSAYRSFPTLSTEDLQHVSQELEASLIHASSMRAVKLNADALTKYEAFTAQLESEREEYSEVMRDMTVRFPMHVLKIALVLAMLRRLTEIDGDAIEAGINLVLSTRDTIRAYMESPARVSPESLIRSYLTSNGPQTLNDLLRALSATFPAKKLNKALLELEDSGHIKRERQERDGNFPEYYALVS
ncbi:MAG: DUF3987 domain-containing protein [Desulfovibrio sp.]|nr:DUF3987 domain-containing protein [Desulfovibrio sp.]